MHHVCVGWSILRYFTTKPVKFKSLFGLKSFPLFEPRGTINISLTCFLSPYCRLWTKFFPLCTRAINPSGKNLVGYLRHGLKTQLVKRLNMITEEKCSNVDCFKCKWMILKIIGDQSRSKKMKLQKLKCFLWSVQMLCPKNIAYHHGFYHVVKRIKCKIKCKIRFTEITFKESINVITMFTFLISSNLFGKTRE